MHSPSDHPGVSGHAGAEHLPPLAVTVRRASKLSGLDLTSIWVALRDGRLEAVRVPGVRRTLVNYASLARLLSSTDETPQPRKRGRPRKTISEAKGGQNSVSLATAPA
jgi:AT hook motif